MHTKLLYIYLSLVTKLIDENRLLFQDKTNCLIKHLTNENKTIGLLINLINLADLDYIADLDGSTVNR